MDFTDRIASFAREVEVWQQLAAQAEGKPDRQQFHLGIARAYQEMGNFLSTITQDDPTTQAQKIHTWMLERTGGDDIILRAKGFPDKHPCFNAGYSGNVSTWLRVFDYDLTLLHREVKGEMARSTKRRAWLRGEEEENATTPHNP